MIGLSQLQAGGANGGVLEAVTQGHRQAQANGVVVEAFRGQVSECVGGQGRRGIDGGVEGTIGGHWIAWLLCASR
jgi:hypothetical protein